MTIISIMENAIKACGDRKQEADFKLKDLCNDYNANWNSRFEEEDGELRKAIIDAAIEVNILASDLEELKAIRLNMPTMAVNEIDTIIEAILKGGEQDVDNLDT